MGGGGGEGGGFFKVCEVRFNPGCSASETSWNIQILHIGRLNMIFQEIEYQVLIRLN